MKTLSEIKNQTKQEQLEILQQIVNEAFEEPFNVSKDMLDWVYEEADLEIGFEYNWEDGYALFCSMVDISKYIKNENNQAKYIYVYIAEHYDAKKDKYYRYYALQLEEEMIMTPKKYETLKRYSKLFNIDVSNESFGTEYHNFNVKGLGVVKVKSTFVQHKAGYLIESREDKFFVQDNYFGTGKINKLQRLIFSRDEGVTGY